MPYKYVKGEKEKATHSNILAWKIPWTDEPVGYSPWGSQRGRHDWATFTYIYTYTFM